MQPQIGDKKIIDPAHQLGDQCGQRQDECPTDKGLLRLL